MKLRAVAASGAIVAASLLLSACISRQEMLARHRAACATYGFDPGSEQYSNCLLQLDVGDYGYGHHGKRRPWSTGRAGSGTPPVPAPPQ